MTVSMLVDAGAYNLCINETIKEQLNLAVKETRKTKLANGSMEEYEMIDPVEAKCKYRRCSVDAFVLKGDTEPLSGTIPMEDMDVLIHPGRRRLLEGLTHAYSTVVKLK